MNYADIVARREELLGNRVDELYLEPLRPGKSHEEKMTLDTEYRRAFQEWVAAFDEFQAVKEVV